MQTCFSRPVQFHYSRSLEDLKGIIEDLRNISTSQDKQNDEKFREEDDFDKTHQFFFFFFFWEEKDCNKLIVMDEV